MKKSFFWGIAFLIVCACEKDNPKTDVDYSIYMSNTSITTSVDFYPLENFKSYNYIGKPDLKLHFVSPFGMMGKSCHLACTIFVENNELIVRFDSIQIYNTYSLYWTYADTYIDLPESVNRISLINGNVVDRYEILISKEKVEIYSIVKNYTDLINDKLFRFPENTFNFTCWTGSGGKTLCTDYLNILFNELSLVEYVFSGEGKIPYPYYTSTSPDHFIAVLKYEKESDFDKAGELLKTFTLEHIPPNTGKSISLIGWNNKQFHSYTFY